MRPVYGSIGRYHPPPSRSKGKRSPPPEGELESGRCEVKNSLYLGRDAETSERIEVDPDLFTTHGVLLGMTGSGKTGLALGLLEELVQAGVPIIAIDPKGDLPNLALLFPEFLPTDFEPWVDPSVAERSGTSLKELAETTAETWKKGLSDAGIDALQVARLKNELDLRIHTPGSTVGRAVNLLGGFQAPTAPSLEPEAVAELAGGVVTGLLSLIDNNVDPLQDPRHVLLVQILTHVWSERKNISLEDLITLLVDPPFAKVGVFPVDRFLAPDARMKLALALNNLVASPAFAAWKQGDPLDISALMTSSSEKTPVNLFCLSHLSEKERQFFVARLMSEILSWTRTLSGTSSLRAFVYFDEAAGYLPPYPASPATKAPILTLLKQSRAVGVGLCIATQNPVDLDYKALSNMGTWMIGRLQTQQDRDRVRDGLLAATGGLTSAELDAEFSKLQPRTFLLKQPKQNRPQIFKTRWAMSYLRGPITLQELKDLPQVESGPAEPATVRESAVGGNAAEGRSTPPPLPKGFSQSFLDPRQVFGHHYDGRFEKHKEPARKDGHLLFRPALHACLRLTFSERKEDFVSNQVHHYIAFPLEDTRDATSLFEHLPLEPNDTLAEPPGEARFANLHEAFDQTEELTEAREQLVEHLYRTLTASRFVNANVKLYSRPEESKDEFYIRCQAAAEELEEQSAVKLREKLQTKIARLEKQMLKSQDKIERLSQSAKGKKLEQLWGAGEMLLSLFTKRKKSFSSVLSKSRQAAEASTRSGQAEEELEKLQANILELQTEMEAGLAELDEEFSRKAEEIEVTEIRLAKKDIAVETFEVLWIPVTSRV